MFTSGSLGKWSNLIQIYMFLQKIAWSHQVTRFWRSRDLLMGVPIFLTFLGPFSWPPFGESKIQVMAWKSWQISSPLKAAFIWQSIFFVEFTFWILLNLWHFIFLTSKSIGAILLIHLFYFPGFPNRFHFGEAQLKVESPSPPLRPPLPRPERWYRPRPRPRTTKFRVRNWSTASLGCLGCLGVTLGFEPNHHGKQTMGVFHRYHHERWTLRG